MNESLRQLYGIDLNKSTAHDTTKETVVNYIIKATKKVIQCNRPVDYEKVAVVEKQQKAEAKRNRTGKERTVKYNEYSVLIAEFAKPIEQWHQGKKAESEGFAMRGKRSLLSP